MSPSAKELGLGIGDRGILHPEGEERLNNLYALGANVGDEVLIVDPTKTNCLPRSGQLVGRLEKTGVDFVFPDSLDLFEPSK